jgi:hypothetical protein
MNVAKTPIFMVAFLVSIQAARTAFRLGLLNAAAWFAPVAPARDPRITISERGGGRSPARVARP